MIYVQKKLDADRKLILQTVERKAQSLERVIPPHWRNSLDVWVEEDDVGTSNTLYTCKAHVQLPQSDVLVVKKEDEDPYLAIKKCFNAARKTVRREFSKKNRVHIAS